MSNLSQTVQNAQIKVHYLGGQAITTSLNIAKVFGKEHKNVLRDIEKNVSELSSDFSRLNFELSNYAVKSGRNTITQQPMYNLTKDAFMILVMGYTGAKAMQFKEAYIKEFNRMRELLEQPKANDIAQIGASQIQIKCLDGKLVMTTLSIANAFDRPHTKILRAVYRIQVGVEKQSNHIRYYGVDVDFFNNNFKHATYVDGAERTMPMYYITLEGFKMLADGAILRNERMVKTCIRAFSKASKKATVPIVKSNFESMQSTLELILDNLNKQNTLKRVIDISSIKSKMSNKERIELLAHIANKLIYEVSDIFDAIELVRHDIKLHGSTMDETEVSDIVENHMAIAKSSIETAGYALHNADRIINSFDFLAGY